MIPLVLSPEQLHALHSLVQSATPTAISTEVDILIQHAILHSTGPEAWNRLLAQATVMKQFFSTVTFTGDGMQIRGKPITGLTAAEIHDLHMEIDTIQSGLVPRTLLDRIAALEADLASARQAVSNIKASQNTDFLPFFERLQDEHRAAHEFLDKRNIQPGILPDRLAHWEKTHGR